MVYPARGPERSGESDYEQAVQEDGAVGLFMWHGASADKGWRFCGLRDKHGFMILRPEEREGCLAPSIQAMWVNARPWQHVAQVVDAAPPDCLAEGEMLHGYYIASEKAYGYFVTTKADLATVLRFTILGGAEAKEPA